MPSILSAALTAVPALWMRVTLESFPKANKSHPEGAHPLR
jgi:hypothetical protein